MPIRFAVRLGVVLLCAAGVAVSLISRDSRLRAEEVFRYYYEEQDARGALARVDDARRLNPNYQIDIAEAALVTVTGDLQGGLRVLNRAVELEPENAELWVELSKAESAAKNRAAARRAYARARELAPRFVPPGGP